MQHARIMDKQTKAVITKSSSSSSLHFQLRPACGLHEYTSQAALEHTQATITHAGPANDKKNCRSGSAMILMVLAKAHTLTVLQPCPSHLVFVARLGRFLDGAAVALGVASPLPSPSTRRQQRTPG
jgi:hypothetical protein